MTTWTTGGPLGEAFATRHLQTTPCLAVQRGCGRVVEGVEVQMQMQMDAEGEVVRARIDS